MRFLAVLCAGVLSVIVPNAALSQSLKNAYNEQKSLQSVPCGKKFVFQQNNPDFWYCVNGKTLLMRRPGALVGSPPSITVEGKLGVEYTSRRDPARKSVFVLENGDLVQYWCYLLSSGEGCGKVQRSVYPQWRQ